MEASRTESSWSARKPPRPLNQLAERAVAGTSHSTTHATNSSSVATSGTATDTEPLGELSLGDVLPLESALGCEAALASSLPLSWLPLVSLVVCRSTNHGHPLNNKAAPHATQCHRRVPWGSQQDATNMSAL